MATIGLVLLVLLASACSSSAPAPAADVVKAAAPKIQVLSNRPDLVSGGDALIEIELPPGLDVAAAKMDVNGRDVSGEFHRRANGHAMGLVHGLALGKNTLHAQVPGGVGAALDIVNHPNGGPIFSGPQIQPWPCLDGATDSQCNRPVAYSYLYWSTDPSACAAAGSAATSCFLPYDPKNPPASVPTTTTDQGKTVPFIVRIEKGTQDRGQYQIAVLFDPTKDWQPWAPQDGWNGKTANHGGGGCATHHGETESAGEFLAEDELARGFLTWETALSHNDRNCNLVVQAESLIMAKEHIVNAYGPIRYTIGEGGSGGSIKLQQAANAYPGIFDGIIPTQSFTDTWSTASGEVLDCRYLVDYFGDPTRWGVGVTWTETEQAAVMGTQSISICQAWLNVFGFDWALSPQQESDSADPAHQKLNTQSCNVPTAEVWNLDTNPSGVRCSLADYMVNVLGRRPQDGYANRPHDNAGVQYGLAALLAGTITPAQFADLNARVGSRDINYNPVPDRAIGDTATMAIAYRTGLFNQGDNMHLPIIDQRGDDNVEIHHNYHSYEMRARLDRSNGNHDNQVIWDTGPTPSGDQKAAPGAFLVMDTWLAAIEADTSDTPYAERVVKNKPASAHDLCTDGNGNELPPDVCALTRPHYSKPRVVAGEPLAGDSNKCQLKPLAQSDYAPLVFTDAEWLQLQNTFPDGVCDYSQPAVGREPTQAWLSYADGPGGQQLPAAPVPSGWAGPSLQKP